MRRTSLAVVVAALAVRPGAARANSETEGLFRRGDNAVVCTQTLEHQTATVFTCYRPGDGRFARFEASDLYGSIRPRVVFGTNPSLVGVVDPRASAVYDGRTWISSDAALIACRVTRTAVRCHHWVGPGFELGAVTGERSFVTRRARTGTSVP